MYRDTLIFKVRGLKLVGARLDFETGIIDNEEGREFSQNLGPLQMEFTTFERDHRSFLVTKTR